MASVYVLTSHWTINTDRTELWRIFEELLESEDLMIWWPAVEVVSNDERGITLRTRSGLGYSLTFWLHDLKATAPEKVSFASSGDLRGNGELVFAPVNDTSCALDIAWNVAVDRAWMKRSSWFLRPIFIAAHTVVMHRAERKLNSWIGTLCC